MKDAPTGGLRGRLHRLTLLQRFLLLEIGIFTVVFFGMLFFVAQYGSQLRDRINHERYLVTESFADQIDRYFDDSITELDTIGRLLETQNGVGPRVSMEGRAARFDRGVVLVRDGDVAAVLKDGGGLSQLLAGELVSGLERTPVFENGVRIWGAKPQAGMTPVVVIAIPAREGAFVVGMVDAVSSDLAQILERAKEVAQTGHADVVDHEGVAVLSTEPEHLLRTSDHPDLYRRQMLLHRGGVFEAPHGDGDDTDPHAMGFVNLGSAPFGFALGGDSSETYAPIRTLWFAFFGLSTVLGVFALTLTVTGVDRLVRPVEHLSRAAHRVANGELETPIEIRGGGEIGELGVSVERMRASLYDWGRELDIRVRERTAELESRNRDLAASAAVAQAAGSTLETKRLLEVVAERIEDSLDVAGAVIVTREDVGVPVSIHRGVRATEVLGSAGSEHCEDCLRRVLSGGGSAADRLLAASLHPCVQGAALPEGLIATQVRLSSRDRSEGMLCVLQRTDASEQVDPRVFELLAAQVAIGLHNARLYGSLREREAQRRSLLAKVMSAQEEERQRLARELHDGTAQSLAAVLLTLDSIEQGGGGDWAEVAERLEQTRELSGDALNELRMMIFALRPPVLDDLGLIAAIRRYAERISRTSSVHVRIDDGLRSRRLLPDAEVTVFRIIQEALNNVIRHSEASEAVVEIGIEGGILRAEVRDNGRGFGVPQTQSALGGVGLDGMAERARLLGGVLTVESAPGRGTMVQLAVAEALVVDEEDREREGDADAS